MESRGGFSLGESEASEILSYYEIARLNGALLSLSDALQLTSSGATEEEFVEAWRGNASLNARFVLEDGYIVERRRDGGAAKQLVSAQQGSRRRAEENLRSAIEFGALCGRGARLFSVSGGNSYKSAKEGDDVDFFCVTKTDSMWVFMLRSLVLARIYRLTRKGVPQLCFSCVMDERRAREEFARPGDRLYARDALTAQVLHGQSFHRSLLLLGGWMERYFPRMYHRRVSEGPVEAGPGGSGSRLLNSLLFFLVGTYVRVKAFILNWRYRRLGLSSSLFEVKVGTGHCIYESNRYKRLRKMYPNGGRPG